MKPFTIFCLQHLPFNFTFPTGTLLFVGKLSRYITFNFWKSGGAMQWLSVGSASFVGLRLCEWGDSRCLFLLAFLHNSWLLHEYSNTTVKLHTIIMWYVVTYLKVLLTLMMVKLLLCTHSLTQIVQKSLVKVSEFFYVPSVFFTMLLFLLYVVVISDLIREIRNHLEITLKLT